MYFLRFTDLGGYGSCNSPTEPYILVTMFTVPIRRLGKKFHRLTVLDHTTADRYDARCECGTVVNVHWSNLMSGKTKSCGPCRPALDAELKAQTPNTPTNLTKDTMEYVDINMLHQKHCPKKTLSNFWRSDGYGAAEKVLLNRSLEAKRAAETPAPGRKGSTLVHPLIAVEFFRWVSPDLHQERLYRALFETPTQ